MPWCWLTCLAAAVDDLDGKLGRRSSAASKTLKLSPRGNTIFAPPSACLCRKAGTDGPGKWEKRHAQSRVACQLLQILIVQQCGTGRGFGVILPSIRTRVSKSLREEKWSVLHRHLLFCFRTSQHPNREETSFSPNISQEHAWMSSSPGKPATDVALMAPAAPVPAIAPGPLFASHHYLTLTTFPSLSSPHYLFVDAFLSLPSRRCLPFWANANEECALKVGSWECPKS